MRDNANSTITRIHGCYSITMYRQTTHFLVMENLFVGCPRAFFEALVCKLQPCICITGDHVFYKGELGESMYFLRRGVAEVSTQGHVLATLREVTRDARTAH